MANMMAYGSEREGNTVSIPLTRIEGSENKGSGQRQILLTRIEGSESEDNDQRQIIVVEPIDSNDNAELSPEVQAEVDRLVEQIREHLTEKFQEAVEERVEKIREELNEKFQEAVEERAEQLIADRQ